MSRAQDEATAFRSFVAERTAPWTPGETPTYAQVVGAINRLAGVDDLALTSAGGLPGEMNVNWLAKGVGTFDCEYGYSTMGYEIAGAWGARKARDGGEVIAFVGDGSYLMLNSELYSATLAGDRLIVVVCDNGGYAVIHRLQVGQGGAAYNNMLEDVRPGLRARRLGRARTLARVRWRRRRRRPRSSRRRSYGREAPSAPR